MITIRRTLFLAAVEAGLVDFKRDTLLSPSGLTALEMMIMRNVVDGTHRRGVTDENKAEHDQAFIDLVKRGLISWHRKRARKFDLTPTGCEALATAEEKQGEVLGVTETVEEGGQHE